MGLLVYSITGKKFVLFILLCLLYFTAVAIRKPNSISDKSSLILERGEKSSVFLCYLSLSFHPLKQAHLFFTITMARLFKVTWSGKVDWPNPKQSVVLAQKAENTKGFKFVLGLGLQGLSSRPCPVPCSLVYPKADSNSALIQDILMPSTYSSKGGFLVLLFSFLHDSDSLRCTHLST